MTVDAPARRSGEWWPFGLRAEDQAEVMSTVDDEGVRRDVHLFVGGLRDRRGGPQGKPQGFLVHMLPGERIGAHFHRVDQFQVFFGASGATFQRTELPRGSVTVQYADAYSTYGPFAAGDAVLEFFTLRAAGDGMVGYMPGARDLLVHRGRRLGQVTFTTREGLAAGETRAEHVFGPDPDGMSCQRIRAGRGATVRGPAVGGMGQYLLVAGGTVEWGGRAFGPKSLAWAWPGSEPLELTAGDGEGFDLLVMQYPDPPSVPVPADIVTGMRDR